MEIFSSALFEVISMSGCSFMYIFHYDKNLGRHNVQWCNLRLRRPADRFALPHLVSIIIPKVWRWQKEG